MKKYAVEKISFSSFMKIIALAGLSLGVLFGVLGFLGSLLGANVTATIGEVALTGIEAGVVSLIIGPLACTFIFGMFGLIAYIPFAVILKIKGKIELLLRIRGE